MAMSEWPQVALGEVTSQSKEPVKVDRNTRYRMLGVRLYSQGAFHRETTTPKASTIYQARAGQFIYNRMFAYKGSFALIAPELDGSYVSNEFPVFECDQQRILPQYLLYYFSQELIWEQIASVSTGTTASRNRWNEAKFNAYQVPLPSVSEQRRIIEVMTAVDLEIAALERELLQANFLLKCRLAELLSTEQHWEPRRLRDCAELVTGRAFPNRHQGNTSGDIPYIKVSDLGHQTSHRIITGASNWVSEATARELTARTCPTGTTIFPIIGAALLTEKRRILGRDAAFDQNLMGLVPREGVVPEFLFAVMSSIQLGELRQSGAVPSVNQSIVGDIEVLLPPEVEQRAIADTYGRMFDVCEKLALELNSTRRVRTDLLEALLSQQITVNESVDRFIEPAA